MQTEFTPLLSALGGALIGLSAVGLMASTGRIAGISGIAGRLLPPGLFKRTANGALENAFVFTFVLGLLLAIPLYRLVTGHAPEFTSVASIPLVILAGVLVGFGSGLGSGCTSGHGVCGLSRLSTRSLVATATFMLTAFITVFIIRHIL